MTQSTTTNPWRRTKTAQTHNRRHRTLEHQPHHPTGAVEHRVPKWSQRPTRTRLNSPRPRKYRHRQPTKSQRLEYLHYTPYRSQTATKYATMAGNTIAEDYPTSECTDPMNHSSGARPRKQKAMHCILLLTCSTTYFALCLLGGNSCYLTNTTL